MTMMRAIDDLMAEAATLVERRVIDPVTLTLLRDDLERAIAGCGDPAAAEDACDMLARLEHTIEAGTGARSLPLAS